MMFSRVKRTSLFCQSFSRLFIEKHLADKHMAEKHLADKHLANKHLADKHLANKHLADKHLADKHLADKHLADKHLADKHLADTVLKVADILQNAAMPPRHFPCHSCLFLTKCMSAIRRSTKRRLT